MLEFTFSDTLSAALARTRGAAIDFTPAMGAIADYMRTETVLNFEAETGPDGVRWKPSQRAIEDGGLTLNDTGHLRSSITAASDATTAIVGTNLVYAAIHQFGGRITPKAGKKALNTPFGPRGAVTMPARPFLGFGPDNIAHIEGVLIAHIADAFNDGARP